MVKSAVKTDYITTLFDGQTELELTPNVDIPYCKEKTSVGDIGESQKNLVSKISRMLRRVLVYFKYR